ncbi:MAG: LacI family transcriptional regulator [Opitutaceae bacterium]|nr:LacI family transcriptional regulator [Opitutaceae bacterium]
MDSPSSRFRIRSGTGPARPRATQQDVARRAGVTQATVSMALRNHPEVSAEMRARVRAVAAELGYIPDPFLSGLSAYRKQIRPARYHATLAWLSNDDGRGTGWKNSPAFTGYFEGALARATELGYLVEEHAVRAAGMTAARLEEILLARNVSGLLLAPQPHPGERLDAFRFGPFSSVTFGYTLASPQLHLVTLHQFRSMETVFRRLLAMGYRRPGLAMGEESDERSGHNWSAAFWSEQRGLPAADRAPPFIDRRFDRRDFVKWFRRYRPDVVIAIWHTVHAWLVEEGVRMPEDAGLVLLSVPDGGRFFSGIWENPQVIGAKAVEFLIDLIHRNERGVPDVPLCMLVAGTWVEGKTVRRQG